MRSRSRRSSRFQAKYAKMTTPGSATPTGPFVSTASPHAAAVGTPADGRRRTPLRSGRGCPRPAMPMQFHSKMGQVWPAGRTKLSAVILHRSLVRVSGESWVSRDHQDLALGQLVPIGLIHCRGLSCLLGSGSHTSSRVSVLEYEMRRLGRSLRCCGFAIVTSAVLDSRGVPEEYSGNLRVCSCGTLREVVLGRCLAAHRVAA